MWNPAHRYFFWGGVCARMGLALFVLVPMVLVIIWHIWNLSFWDIWNFS
jgi:hypothetical protein